MKARKLYCIVPCVAAVLWPAGCGSLMKSDSGADQNFITDARKSRNQDARDADGPTIQPETYLAAGRLHETQGRLVKAAEQYRLAVASKPDWVEASNRLGIVLDRLGRFKEADEVFAKAIRLAPDKAHLHNNLAFSYILQQRWREAEISLTKAIEINPAMTRARVNLAMVVAQQGRFDEAFTQFKTVLPIEDAHYNMGLMYQSKRLNVEAARSFKAALKANPKLVAAQQRLDALPKDVVSQAEQTAETTTVQNTPAVAAQNTETAASPLPEDLQLAAVGTDLVSQPTTRPAIEQTTPTIERSSSAMEESASATEQPSATIEETLSTLQEESTLSVEPMPEEQQVADSSVLDVAAPEPVESHAVNRGLVSQLMKQLSDHMMRYVVSEPDGDESVESLLDDSQDGSEDGRKGDREGDAVVTDNSLPRDD